jgi:hypothetical protein
MIWLRIVVNKYNENQILFRRYTATKLSPLCGYKTFAALLLPNCRRPAALALLFYQPYSTKLAPLCGTCFIVLSILFYQTCAALRHLLHCFINLILPNLRRSAALALLFYQPYSTNLRRYTATKLALPCGY